jgi:hypothetical protein
MLLTRDILIERLIEHLKKSDQIDVAVAWAADCNALARLCEFARSGGSLRAIVGIWGNATHPNAVRGGAIVGHGAAALCGCVAA